MTRNASPFISDADWLEYVLDFIFAVMASADENRPVIYSSRIDGYLMPFNGRVS